MTEKQRAKENKMKTEQEWLKIYHEVCDSLPKGHNRVRLKLGQYDTDDIWACIEILCPNKELLKELIVISDKYNLIMDFQGREFKLWEHQKDDEAVSMFGGNKMTLIPEVEVKLTEWEIEIIIGELSNTLHGIFPDYDKLIEKLKNVNLNTDLLKVTKTINSPVTIIKVEKVDEEFVEKNL